MNTKLNSFCFLFVLSVLSLAFSSVSAHNIRTVKISADGCTGKQFSLDDNTKLNIKAEPNVGYVFKSWSDGVSENPRTLMISKDTTLIASFEFSTKLDTISTVSPLYGGTVTGTGIYLKGSSITLIAVPDEGFTFVQWIDGSTENPRNLKTNGNAVYTPVFKGGYKVKIYADGCTESFSQTVAKNVGLNLTAVQKEHYVFAGWSDGVNDINRTVIIEKDTTIYAMFRTEKYPVIFTNYNGTVLQNSEFAYGETPVYSGLTPTRPSDMQYSYAFTGWSPTISSVTGPQIYTAQFSSGAITYTVRFLNYDGTELQKENLDYGVTPSYKGSAPTKPSTAQYSYTFNGWDSEIGMVTGAKDYTATYTSTENKYEIKFVNYDGSELQSGEVSYGDTPVYTGETPSRPSTAQYTYTFTGWSPAIEAVTGAQTYTAQYSRSTRTYIIRFLNYNGLILKTMMLAYGKTPVYKGITPTRASTAQYTYTFSGWDPAITTVTGSKDYTATYASTVNKYEIKFVNYDGAELQTGEVEYGKMPAYTGSTPTKPAGVGHTYTFIGWSPAIEAVTDAQTYTAQFSSTVNKYVVRFLNEDGTELQSEELKYLAIPFYTGKTPTKDATAQYTYTFKGWNPSITMVTGAKDYTATYSRTVNKYTVTLSGINCDVTGDGVYDYGTEVELRATPHDGYAFQSWSDGNTDNPRTIVVDRDYDISANMCKASFENISATIFKGDYYEFGDRHLTQRGTYTETFLNKAGCDSVVVLTLSVIPVPTYNVRLSVYKDETWGSVTGDGTYRKGATATLNAVPASGYKFSYWYDQDTQERFYENPLSLVVERAVSLTASFSRAPKIKVTYGQRSAEVEGDGDEDVISYVVSTKQHVDIDNVGSRSILIYSTAGQIMLRQVNVEHYEGHLPSGVYIINIDGVMEKFIVR